jgi:hypothetical protein
LRSDPRIEFLGILQSPWDAAISADLAGVTSPRREPEAGSRAGGASEPDGVLEGRHERQDGDRPDTGSRHRQSLRRALLGDRAGPAVQFRDARQDVAAGRDGGLEERNELRRAGNLTRTALEGFGKTLETTDEAATEATDDAMTAAQAPSPFLARVAIANPRAGRIRIDRRPKSTDVIDVPWDLSILRGVPGHGRATGEEDAAEMAPEGLVIPL